MLKKISILVQGNLVAHIFTLIALLVLPKFYGPDQFGLFATFIGASNIIYIVLSGRYERALLLPESEEKAKLLYIFTFLLSLFLFSIFFILTFIFHTYLGYFFNEQFMDLWVYIVLPYALLLSLSETATYYLNRFEEYKQMARSKIILTATSLVVSITSGLIWGEVVSRFIALAYMLRKNTMKLDLRVLPLPKLEELKHIAIEYKDFPLKSLSGGTLGMISNSIPLLFIAKIFSLEIAGYYLLAYKLLSLPAALLSKSISHVFYKHAIIEDKHNNLSSFILKTTLVLFIISLVILILFYQFIDFIAAMFFSDEWLGMVVIAKIFAPLFAINFIYTCQSTILMVKKKLSYELFFNSLIFVALVTIYTSSYLFDVDYIMTFSLSAFALTLIYSINILYIFKISKEKSK